MNSRDDEARGLQDHSLQELLRALREERADLPEAERLEDDRRDTELLGLLAHELEEVAPAAEVRERLMAAVRADASSTAGASPAPSSPPSPAESGGEVVPWLARPAGGVAVGSTVAATPRWLTALAAALLLAVVGLAVFVGLLFGEVREQRRTIAELGGLLAEADGSIADLSSSRAGLASRLALIASPGVEVCPLRPRGDSPQFAEARGLLFLSGPRDEWYVRVANVEPAPRGYTYRLWFVVGDEVQAAGVLEPDEGNTVVLAGGNLPASEEMTAALITLEPSVQSAVRPSGPTVLYGDEKMEIL